MNSLEDIFKVYVNVDELNNRTVYRLVMYFPTLRSIIGRRTVGCRNRMHY